MSEMEKSSMHLALDQTYSSRGARLIAGQLDYQADADDVAQAIRDASVSKSLMPVLWDLRRPYRRFLAITSVCAVLVATMLMLVVFWPERIIGARLYAALVIVGVATTVSIWGALRARAIRLEDARHPSVVNAAEVEDANIFVRIFGPVAQSDAAGMLLLALAGGLDGALCGWVVSNGLADSVPLIGVFIASSVFAVIFIAALRWIVSKFVACCGSIRAKRWVVALSNTDFQQYPQKKAELVYVTQKLSHLTGDDFPEPTIRDYVSAAGLLLLIPALFGLLLAFRMFIANHNGAADLDVVLGLSALCAVIGTLAAGLAATSHLLAEEGTAKTKLAKRFPSVSAYQNWLAAYTRETRRWANEAARQINNALRQRENKSDYRRKRSGIAVPRPFPTQETKDAPADPTLANIFAPTMQTTVAAATGQVSANESSQTAQPKEAA